jgi:hypothetical protein
MNHSKRCSSLLTAAVLPFGIAACGSSSNLAPSAPGPKVTITNTGIVNVPGDGPVSTDILIDRTAVLGNQTLAEAYKETALQAAAPTIARGGELNVSVFGRLAGRSLPVYTVQIPTLAQAGDAARNNAAQTSALTAALNVAVGLTPPPSAAAAAELGQVTKVEGSDIGAAAGEAITGLANDPSPTRDIVLETDGWIVRQAQAPLSQVLAHNGPTGAAALIVKNANLPAGTRPVSLLEIEGLGSTAGHNDPGAQTIQNLDQAYQLACGRLPVQNCEVAGS